MEIETLNYYCQAYELQAAIRDHMRTGWSVLYVIEDRNSNTIQIHPLTRTGNATVGSDGSLSIFIPGQGTTGYPSGPPPHPGWEICFYKDITPPPIPVPCPRCSYPATDDSRIDREV